MIIDTCNRSLAKAVNTYIGHFQRQTNMIVDHGFHLLNQIPREALSVSSQPSETHTMHSSRNYYYNYYHYYTEKKNNKIK